MAKKHLYVRLALTKWKNAFEVADPISGGMIKITPEVVGSVGFLEVFGSKEAMHKAYPGCKYAVMQYGATQLDGPPEGE